MTHFHIMRDHKPTVKAKRPEPKTVSCACGCGETVTAIHYKGRIRQFVRGHSAKLQTGWTEGQTNTLKSMWGKASARAIGEAVGMTKDAIIGKAHRIGLPVLQAPTRVKMTDAERLEKERARDRVRRERKRQEREAIGLVKRPKRAPRLVSVNTAPNVKPKLVSAVPPKRKKARRPMVDLDLARNARVHISTIVDDRNACRYPITPDMVKTHEHRFCSGPAEEGSPYCAIHSAVAFVPNNHLLEQAA